MPRFKDVIRELHRRSLWQVLGIYAVASWVIYQVVLGIYDGVGLPAWVPATSLVLLLVGLPIVLATAFVQEGGPRLGRHEDRGETPAGFETASAALAPTRDTAPDQVPEGTARPAGAQPSDPSRRGPWLTWARALIGGVLAFAALGLAAAGFMATRALGIGPAATLMSRGVMEARDPIVVAEFENATTDPTLGDLTTEALRIDLSQSPAVSVLSEAAGADALRRMEREPDSRLTGEVARALAVREGLKAVLEGRIQEAVGSYVLSARLVAPQSGRVLAAFRETAGDSTELIPALDRLSAAIRGKVGESLRSVRAAKPLATVTTSSLEALRLYTRGDYRGAVQADSTFAMAWRKLGIELGSTGAAPTERAKAFTRAYELRNRVGPRERGLAEGSYYWSVTGDLDASAEAYRRVIAAYPDEQVAQHNLGVAYWCQGRLEEAERQFHTAFEVGRKGVNILNLARSRAAQGRSGAALATLDSIPPDLQDSTYWHLWPEAEFLAVQGRYAASDSVARELAAKADDHALAQRRSLEIRMVNNVVRGRVADARQQAQELRDVAGVRQEEAFRPERIRIAAYEAEVEAAMVGDTLRATAIIEDALAAVPLDSLSPEDRPFGSLALALALAHQTDRAARYLALHDSVAHEGGAVPVDDLDGARTNAARVLIDLDRGRIPEARVDLRQAMKTTCRYLWDLLPPLQGEIHEGAGQPDSAIVAYERFVKAHPADLGRQRALYEPLVMERLAMLYEEAGREREAAAYYRRLIDLWRNADPELQPRVDAARRALARMAAEPGS